jgi:hypothetical protein
MRVRDEFKIHGIVDHPFALAHQPFCKWSLPLPELPGEVERVYSQPTAQCKRAPLAMMSFYVAFAVCQQSGPRASIRLPGRATASPTRQLYPVCDVLQSWSKPNSGCQQNVYVLDISSKGRREVRPVVTPLKLYATEEDDRSERNFDIRVDLQE